MYLYYTYVHIRRLAIHDNKATIKFNNWFFYLNIFIAKIFCSITDYLIFILQGLIDSIILYICSWFYAFAIVQRVLTYQKHQCANIIMSWVNSSKWKLVEMETRLNETRLNGNSSKWKLVYMETGLKGNSSTWKLV